MSTLMLLSAGAGAKRRTFGEVSSSSGVPLPSTSCRPLANAALLAHLDDERIEHHERVRRGIQRTRAEGLDQLIELAAELGDLALAHRLDAQLGHRLLHAARREAG